jgi:hypothetical protein
MGVAEVEHIGACGIEKRRAERIDALAPPDHRCLPAGGKSGQRSQRGFDRRLAAAGERNGKKIQQSSLGLVYDRRLKRIPFCLGDELRQPFGHTSIVRHPHPSCSGASIDRRGQKCKDAAHANARCSQVVRLNWSE